MAVVIPDSSQIKEKDEALVLPKLMPVSMKRWRQVKYRTRRRYVDVGDREALADDANNSDSEEVGEDQNLPSGQFLNDDLD